jgi:hypothetical protein
MKTPDTVSMELHVAEKRNRSFQTITDQRRIRSARGLEMEATSSIVDELRAGLYLCCGDKIDEEPSLGKRAATRPARRSVRRVAYAYAVLSLPRAR